MSRQPNYGAPDIPLYSSAVRAWICGTPKISIAMEQNFFGFTGIFRKKGQPREVFANFLNILTKKFRSISFPEFPET